MAVILERASQRTLPEAAQRYDSDGLRMLVALRAELQRTSGEEPFFVSCRTAGELLEVNHGTACRWLHLQSLL